jgi:UDP-N-acetylglucosamine 2-epimerase (non-hydrolysing)
MAGGKQAGTMKLVGTDKNRIFEETANLLQFRTLYMEMVGKGNPYGDGRASERILDYILKINL